MIELLAPAKNYEYGVAAINAGADAVYIGAPKFGARYSATNTLDDIKDLTEYAHQYGVKVFVTLNTVLYDHELQQAKEIAQSLVEIGIDALIVQDMSYLMFGLDIPLHASTQAAALTPEKALFYEQAGFERIILERAMSLEDIEAIRKVTTVELEVFVHGAICVSMSGQCYMSQAVAGRSGNRGVCAQPCRTTYNLLNECGEVILKNKHLLSLQDLNLSDYIPQLIECGITSFKIEGRLKDISYLKNSVAFYRQIIDQTNTKRASVGESVIPFEPNPIKTFSRRFTPYFIEGKATGKIASFDTAKAIGEEVGRIDSVSRQSFSVVTKEEFRGGDGVCFIDKEGNFGGTNINMATREGKMVVFSPNAMEGILQGAILYRNFDKRYIDRVTNAKLSRQIKTTVEVIFGDNLHLKVIDTTGVSAEIEYTEPMEDAKNKEIAKITIQKQLSKSGDTIFEITDVEVKGDVKFLAVATLNSLRRLLLEQLRQNRLFHYQRNKATKTSFPKLYVQELDYRANVTNALSRAFYEKCGATKIEDGVECRKDTNGIELMNTRYCIRKEIGECLKEGGKHKRLFLEDKTNRFELIFDCAKCRMKLMKV